MQWHRKYLIALLLIFCVCSGLFSFFVTLTSANELRSLKSNDKELLSAYFAAAFANGNTQLRKFNRVKPLTISFECLADKIDDCIKPIDLFKSNVSSTDRLNFLYMKRQGEFHLIIVEEDKRAGLQAKLEKDFHKGILDSSATDCQFFINSDKMQIVNSVVVISTETELSRMRTCLLVNFFRSLGLSLNNGELFATAFGYSYNPKSSFTAAQIDELKYRIEVLLYIHSCRRLRPGMTEEEVRAEFSSGSECLKNIVGGSNG